MKQFLNLNRILLTEAAEKTLTFGIKNNGTLPFVVIDGETLYFGKYCDFTKLTYTRFNPDNYAVYMTDKYKCIIEIGNNPFTHEKLNRMKNHSADAIQSVYKILRENGVTTHMTHPKDVVGELKRLIKTLSTPPVAPPTHHEEEEQQEDFPDDFVEPEYAMQFAEEPAYTPEMSYFDKLKIEVHIPIGCTKDSIYRNVHLYAGNNTFEGYAMLDITNIMLDIDLDIFKAVIEKFKHDFKDALPNDSQITHVETIEISDSIIKCYKIVDNNA